MGEDLQKRKVLNQEWKSEEEMNDDSGESKEPMEDGRSVADDLSW